MMVASKGAAGVTGAGLATLAAGLQSHRPELLDGIGLVVGIDKFMSEARALTNFSGNAVATVVIGGWTQSLDHRQMHQVLDGNKPFDERTMVDDNTDDTSAGDQEPAKAGRKPALWAVNRNAGIFCRPFSSSRGRHRERRVGG